MCGIAALVSRVFVVAGLLTSCSAEPATDLDLFASARDKLLPTNLVTVLWTSQISLTECAKACRAYNHTTIRTSQESSRTINRTGPGYNRMINRKRRKYSRKINRTGSVTDQTNNHTEDFLTCQAFEHVENARICMLLNLQAHRNRHSPFSNLRPADGTTFYLKGQSAVSLFMESPKHVLSGELDYYRLLNVTSNEMCAHACLDTSGVKCNSFAYSARKNVCALSSFTVDKNHKLMETDKYDFYQYRGDWPCNVTIPWKYSPRILASSGYPFLQKGKTLCWVNIIPPPSTRVVLVIMALFGNLTCKDRDAGVFIYGGVKGTSRVCNKIQDNIQQFRGKLDSNVTVVISRGDDPFVTRMAYNFEKIQGCHDGHCLNGGTCHVRNGSVTCSCSQGHTGHRCEQNAEDSPCSSQPCLFDGQCMNSAEGYTCVCLPGTTGKNCQVFLGECHKQPCSNGTCSPVPNASGYICACPAGYTGSNCEYEINECFSSPCIHGECVDQINGYSCTCFNGFKGEHCDFQIGASECKPMDCKFGTCALNETGSYCQCFPGFSGKFCDRNIDECTSSPCSHGTCVDHVNRYICNCFQGYEGKRCDILSSSPCKNNPCNNGYCSVMNIGYHCVCNHGFTGEYCDTIVNGLPTAAPSYATAASTTSTITIPSSYSATISSSSAVNTLTKNSVTILHPVPTLSSYLSTSSSYATITPISTIATSPYTTAFIGRKCEDHLDCGIGRCQSTGYGYKCICPEGHTGYKCRAKVNNNTCNTYNCVHGVCATSNYGSLQSTNYKPDLHNIPQKCFCKPGYTGSMCNKTVGSENFIQSVTGRPCGFRCYNSGTCVLVNGRFRCSCTKSFTGKFCESLVGLEQISSIKGTTLDPFTRIQQIENVTKGRNQSPSPFNSLNKIIVTSPPSRITHALTMVTPDRRIDESLHTTILPDIYGTSSLVNQDVVQENSKQANLTAVYEAFHPTTPKRVHKTSSPTKRTSVSVVPPKSTNHRLTITPFPTLHTKSSAKTPGEQQVFTSTHGNTIINNKLNSNINNTNGNTLLPIINTNSSANNIGEQHGSPATRGNISVGNTSVSKTGNINGIGGDTPGLTVNGTLPVSITLRTTTTKTSTDAENGLIPTTQGKTAEETSRALSNHVITWESILIGALAASLLAVIGIALTVLYRRSRSGTVYITQPAANRNPNEQGNHVKKRFSSRDIYTEMKTGRFFNPNYADPNTAAKRIALPRNALQKRSPSPSSPAQSAESSSPTSSQTGQYEPVRTHGHVISSSSQSEESSSSEDGSVKFNRRKGRAEPHPSQQRTKTKSTSNQLNNRTERLQRSSIKPFFRKDDGTLGLRLNSKDNSLSPEEFQTLLDQLVSQGQLRTCNKPGYRSKVHQITGAEFGKSEA